VDSPAGTRRENIQQLCSARACTKLHVHPELGLEMCKEFAPLSSFAMVRAGGGRLRSYSCLRPCCAANLALHVCVQRRGRKPIEW